MAVDIRLLGPGEAAVLDRIAPGVFDDPLDARATREFIADPRHHLVVAVEDDVVVGMVTAVHYVHPDKPAPELWINELSVASTHRRRGLATAVLNALLEGGRALGCAEAWVLTERTNVAAMRAYAGVGGVEAPRDQVLFSFGLSPEG